MTGRFFAEQIEKIVVTEQREAILHFYDWRIVRESVVMKGYCKGHYPPEVLAYRARQMLCDNTALERRRQEMEREMAVLK